jgi:hypothetical protein
MQVSGSSSDSWYRAPPRTGRGRGRAGGWARGRDYGEAARGRIGHPRAAVAGVAATKDSLAQRFSLGTWK